MIKKLLRLSLATSFLLLSFLTSPVNSRMAWAHLSTTPTCSSLSIPVSFSPALTDGTPKTQATFDQNGKLPPFKFNDRVYKLKVKDTNVPSEQGTDYGPKQQITTSNPTTPLVFENIVGASGTGGTFIGGDKVEFLIFDESSVLLSGTSHEDCYEIETVAGTPAVNNCTLAFDSLDPSRGVIFHVNDLPGDDSTQRGVALTSTDASGNPIQDVSNSCTTNAVLKATSGYQVTTQYANNAVQPGYYKIRVTDSCFTGSTVNGPDICSTPILLKVDASCSANVNSCVIGTIQPNVVVTLPPPCVPDANNNCSSIQTAFGAVQTKPDTFIQWVLGFILSLAGGILILIIILSGYRLMTSQGDPEKIKEARDRLTAAIVGLLFIIFSFVVFQFVTHDILRLPGFS